MRRESKQKKASASGMMWKSSQWVRQQLHQSAPDGDGLMLRAIFNHASGYLKWMVLNIPVLAGLSGTEGGATRMEASNGTLVGGRQA